MTGNVAPATRIEVVPATPERWDDIVAVLGGNRERGCWCQAPRGVAKGYGSAAPGERRQALRAQLEDSPPPGMLAFADGEIAGWCGFGVRTRLPRMERSRTIPKIDDQPVWSVLCFNVRTEFRRRGVARALLEGVVAYAHRSGAPGVEAYPIDPEGGRVNTSFGYVGVTPMFEQLGFERIVETSAHSDRRPRILMRLMFQPPVDHSRANTAR